MQSHCIVCFLVKCHTCDSVLETSTMWESLAIVYFFSVSLFVNNIQFFFFIKPFILKLLDLIAGIFTINLIWDIALVTRARCSAINYFTLSAPILWRLFEFLLRRNIVKLWKEEERSANRCFRNFMMYTKRNVHWTLV